MGFDDRDIVALSGAHTVGRCHKVRSGFDGPWTTNPLKFDNEYFRNLMNLEWVPRKWDGPLQYTDAKTETLIMLPTDMALKTDPVFAPIAREYANDQSAFFRDFSSAFARLVAKGAPAACQPRRRRRWGSRCRTSGRPERTWTAYMRLETRRRGGTLW